MKFNYIKAIEKLNGTLYYEDEKYVCAVFNKFRLHNEIEQFYKIGISKTPAKRFKQYKQDGFNIGDNIILFNQDAGLIFCLEDDLLNSYKSEKYIPTKKFKGYTECFTYVDIAEVQEMFYTLVRCKREIEELS